MWIASLAPACCFPYRTRTVWSNAALWDLVANRSNSHHMANCAVLCYDGLCTLFTSSSVQMSSTPARLRLQLPTFDWLVDRGSQCLSMKNYSVELPTINHQGVGSPSFKHHGIMVRIERSKTCELTASTQTPHIRSDPSSIPIVYGCKCRFHRHLPCKGDV